MKLFLGADTLLRRTILPHETTTDMAERGVKKVSE